MVKGKCFSKVNRGQRKKSDFYETPYSMTWQLLEKVHCFGNKDYYDPACGNGAIIEAAKKFLKIPMTGNDVTKGCDFLQDNTDRTNIVTNPPFSLANEFIEHCKKVCTERYFLLLPLVYLHGQNRYKKKLFEELDTVYVFTRMPMLGEELREDGKYNTGMQVYAWFYFKPKDSLSGEPIIKWINNNEYVLTKKDK